MKRHLKKLFFWDKPGQGAFFGMTLLMALPWLYFTLLCILFTYAKLLEWILEGQQIIIFLIILLGISLYPLFVYAISLGQAVSPQASLARKLIRWGFVSILCLLPFVFLFGGYATFTFSILLLLFGTAFLLPSAGAWWKRIPLVLLWPIGFTGLFLMFAYAVLPFFVTFDKLPSGSFPIVEYHDFMWLTAIRELLMISGVGWKWLAIMTFLCIAAGYLLQTQALCRFWKVSFWECLSKRAISVLVLSLLIYLISLPFALLEEAKYRILCQDLDRYVSKTISSQNQAEEPNNDYQHAEQAWRELKQASEEISLKQEWKDNFYLGAFNAINILKSEWEAGLLEKWATFYLSQKELEFINDFLNNEIPLAPQHYHDFATCKLMGDDYLDSEILYKCFQAQLWQLRFALEAKDASQVCLLFARMEKICSYLYKKDLPAYLATRERYLSALCLFIESGLVERQWIGSQRELFRKLEEESNLLEEQERLRAQVRWRAFFEAIAHRLDDTPISVGAELSQLRYFFPQAWWPASAKARTALKALGEFQAECDRTSSYSGTAFAAREICRIKRYAKQANTLAKCGQVLLDAEKLRQQTGSFPETMPSLPLDPFTRKPLQYEIGAFEFEIQYVSNSNAMDGSDDDSSTEDIDCKEVHVNPRWKDISSSAKMLRVFSPGYKLQTIYVDICFYIKLE